MDTAHVTTQPKFRPTVMERLRRWRWSLLLGVLIVGNVLVVGFVMKRMHAAEDKPPLQIAPPAQAVEPHVPLPLGQVVLFFVRRRLLPARRHGRR